MQFTIINKSINNLARLSHTHTHARARAHTSSKTPPCFHHLVFPPPPCSHHTHVPTILKFTLVCHTNHYSRTWVRKSNNAISFTSTLQETSKNNRCETSTLHRTSLSEGKKNGKPKTSRCQSVRHYNHGCHGNGARIAKSISTPSFALARHISTHARRGVSKW